MKTQKEQNKPYETSLTYLIFNNLRYFNILIYIFLQHTNAAFCHRSLHGGVSLEWFGPNYCTKTPVISEMHMQSNNITAYLSQIHCSINTLQELA